MILLTDYLRSSKSLLICGGIVVTYWTLSDTDSKIIPGSGSGSIED